MAIIELELIDLSPLEIIDSYTIDAQMTSEVISDAAGLSRLHELACGRAIPNEDGSGTLVHEDDPSFRFVVGKFETSQYIKLGNNGVHTLFYAIEDDKVFQYIAKGNSLLQPGIDISDNTLEIAALANVIQKGI